MCILLCFEGGKKINMQISQINQWILVIYDMVLNVFFVYDMINNG